MIDIRIGRTLEAAPEPARVREREEHGLSGRIVSARKGRGGSAVGAIFSRDRREAAARRDPSGARVLTILIPEGASLPDDEELRDKRVVLKILD